MHLLFILTELPYPAIRSGIALINHELLRQSPADAQIDLLITGIEESPEDIARLRFLAPSVNRIEFTGEPLSRKYRVGNLLSGVLCGCNLFTQLGVRHYLRNLDRMPDVIYVAPLMAGLDFSLARPLFLNAVDSFARLNESAYVRTGHWLYRLKMVLYRFYERRTLRSAAMINFVSSADFESVCREAPGLPLINISNGVDSSKFTPDESCRVPGRLLFTGNFDYAPNAEAALHFVANVFPLIRSVIPSVTLYIVGPNPPPQICGEPGVFVTGFVEDISLFYRSAQVFVCFLLSGAGVKNKVLEAMSSGLPVVTTQLGVDGIDYLEAERHYLLANDPHSFANCVLLALENEQLLTSLGQEARAVISKHYGWTPIVDRYFTAMRQVAESRS